MDLTDAGFGVETDALDVESSVIEEQAKKEEEETSTATAEEAEEEGKRNPISATATDGAAEELLDPDADEW